MVLPHPIRPAIVPNRRNPVSKLPMKNQTTWVLTEGMAGMVTQAVGLAEAVGLPFEQKTITLRAPWRWLPPRFWPQGTLGLAPSSDPLTPPWPDLVISCGRKSVGPALAVKHRSGGKCFAVHIQNPHVPSRAFDLIVAATHDGLIGDNVVVTRSALHRTTPARLKAEGMAYTDVLATRPRPLIAVLVGGPNRVYHMTPEIITDFASKLTAFAKTTGGSLAVTPSRRTGADNVAALQAGLKDSDAVIWDGTGDNPYFGYLAHADQIVVTCDSVSMVSEACATGKPVYVFDLPGGGKKFRLFHDGLREQGVTRAFTGAPDDWQYEPFDDTASVAAEIRKRMASAA
jgi:mitochondrial fission protein ELM1